MTAELGEFSRVFEELSGHGVLLESDSRLPSISSRVAGEPVSGSWWSHPQAHAIYAIAERMNDHADVVVAKLVSGKRTYVHRKLWSRLFSIATAREPWQTKYLSRGAQWLFETVAEKPGLRTDHIRSSREAKQFSVQDAVRELELKLLIYSENFHSEAGAHAKRLDTWENWAARGGLLSEGIAPQQARQEFEALVSDWNRRFRASATLPWFARARQSRSRSLVLIVWLAFAFAWAGVGSRPVLAAEVLWSQKLVAAESNAEFHINIRARAPGTSWNANERPCALLKVFVDERYDQHLFLVGGAEEMDYDFLIGPLERGEHDFRIEWDTSWTPALRDKPEIRSLAVRVLDRADRTQEPILRAPILYLRNDTVGRFSDVPLLLYWDLEKTPDPQVTYTFIFSNEDGGTETERLMARWGRTTDIEWCYGYASFDGQLREEFQGRDHKTLVFRGRKEGWHPVLYNATLNNNFAETVPDAADFRVRMFPVAADLEGRARESVMDRFPWTYSIMAREMLREQKLETPPNPHTPWVSDLRNYAYFEVCSFQRGTELYFELQLKKTRQWFSSTHDDPKSAIGRSGCVRSTVELPEGTRFEDLDAFRIRCRTAADNGPVESPAAEITAVHKLFFLDKAYRPGPNLLERALSQTLVPGESLTLHLPSGTPFVTKRSVD